MSRRVGAHTVGRIDLRASMTSMRNGTANPAMMTRDQKVAVYVPPRSRSAAERLSANPVDVLVHKARKAAKQAGATGIVLGGGVAANSLLREELLTACHADGIQGFLPSRAMCTDNAAMIAAAGWHRLKSDGPTSLDVGASPNLKLPFID